MGRRNWMFAWLELGARRVGVMQRLPGACRLPAGCRVSILTPTWAMICIDWVSPAKQVNALTLRVWKTPFADRPWWIEDEMVWVREPEGGPSAVDDANPGLTVH